jgi:hypothetical protein
VSPDLLARACNRLCPAESESTTADSDIVCRRWLLIDCDAVRKAKISSTDAEHEAALAKAREIRDGLTSLGWPMPVMLDSGNGAQMTYRIDLPADDGGVVQQAVTEIAKASIGRSQSGFDRVQSGAHLAHSRHDELQRRFHPARRTAWRKSLKCRSLLKSSDRTASANCRGIVENAASTCRIGRDLLSGITRFRH